MLRKALRSFWHWYERHYVVNLVITSCLFLLQLFHLYWLGTDVIASRLTGHSLFSPLPHWQYIIVAVDYTEIPALLSASILYLYGFLQRKWYWKNVSFLILINSQWLHLFWITDEFVITALAEGKTGSILPTWLAWIAILIDYLEIPVIVDMLIHTLRALTHHRFVQFFKKEARYHIWHI